MALVFSVLKTIIWLDVLVPHFTCNYCHVTQSVYLQQISRKLPFFYSHLSLIAKTVFFYIYINPSK